MKKKFKIWTEKCKESSSNEYCYLRLDEGKTDGTDSGDVAIIACDADGKQILNGVILVLDSKLGVIINVTNISDDIPLKADIANTALVYDDREAEEILRPSFSINQADLMARMAEHAENCPAHKDQKPTIN